MKKVLIITYYWPPSGGAGVQRWLKFSKYFLRFNLSPIILTVDEKFASYPVLDESLQKEIPENIKVVRTKTNEPFSIYKKVSGNKQIPSGGFATGGLSSVQDKIIRFIRGNFFIPDARKGWNRFAFARACEIIREEKPIAVITTSPPHSTQLIGLKLKKKFNLPWIADLRDPWTDIYYYEEMLHTFMARLVDKNYEKNVLKSADRIVAVSESIKNSFVQKGAGITPEKIFVIPNGYDEDDFSEKTDNISPDEFIISYTGTIAESYAPYKFFSAIDRLIKNNPDSKIIFRFMGIIPETMLVYLKSLSWSNRFEFIPYSSHNKVIECLLSSSVLYLAIPRAKGNKGILTGKLFEYLAAQKPIVATGPADGDAAAIISSCKAGKMFEPEDESGILSCLQTFLDDWKAGKKISVESGEYKKYSRKYLAEQFSKLILIC